MILRGVGWETYQRLLAWVASAPVSGGSALLDLIDGVSDEPLRGATILVRDGRIEGIEKGDREAEFKTRCLGHGYVLAFPGAEKTFRAVDTGVRIEMITAGEYPGDGRPKPVRFPDPAEASVEIGGIRVLSLERLIELKLASGMTASHRRRDLADVQDLIRALRLPADFAERLDSSVRPLYQQLWQEAQAPDPFQEG